MAYTKVQIISNALCQLGQKPIIALQNQSDIVSAAEQAFDFLLPQIISDGTWRFAAKIGQLTKLVEVPIVTNWAYIYQLPADYLGLIRLFPQNYNFEIYAGDKLYSNLDSPMWIEYKFQPEVGRMSTSFGVYFSYEIALYLALSNAQYASFAQVLDQKVSYRRAQAMASDAQNRPQTPMISQPVISNRSVGGIYGNNG